MVSEEGPPAEARAARLALPFVRARATPRCAGAQLMSSQPQPVEGGRPSEAVAGFLAALSIFASLFALAYRPVRMIPFAIILALIASGMGGRHARLGAFAVALSTVCFIAAMVIAVLTKHPLY